MIQNIPYIHGGKRSQGVQGLEVMVKNMWDNFYKIIITWLFGGDVRRAEEAEETGKKRRWLIYV